MVEKKRNGYKTTLHVIAVSKHENSFKKLVVLLVDTRFICIHQAELRHPEKIQSTSSSIPQIHQTLIHVNTSYANLKHDAYYNYKKSKDYNINNLIKCVQDAWDNLPERRLLPVFIKTYKKFIYFFTFYYQFVLNQYLI